VHHTLVKKTIFIMMEEQIINMYLGGKTNKQISEQFSIHRTTVQRILKRNNVLLRKQTETSRQHNIVNFTGKIKTDNDAYILGLIYSDGNLNRNCIEISLNEDDKQLLEDVSQFVYGKIILSYKKERQFKHKNGKIYKQRGQYRFHITSKQVCENLREMGLCENKSLKLKAPKIAKKYLSHFIRGLFDGDGCLFVSSKYKGTNRVTMVFNYQFCEQLKILIESVLDINVRVNYKTPTVGCVSISGNNQIKKIMMWIYNKSKLKLDRKYSKYISAYPVDDAKGNAQALLKIKEQGLKISLV
jgi:intein-encoded DNA endonuclease-like protein